MWLWKFSVYMILLAETMCLLKIIPLYNVINLAKIIFYSKSSGFLQKKLSFKCITPLLKFWKCKTLSLEEKLTGFGEKIEIY